MQEKLCVICGKPLSKRAIRRGAVCCGASCAAKNRPSRARVCVCVNCGREFVGGSVLALYCSKRCGIEYRRKQAADVPRLSQIDKISAEARNVGLSYGQLQARRYLEKQKGGE